jgi:hypothetical protein
VTSTKTATTARDTSFDAVRRRLALALRDTGPVSAPRPLEIQPRGVLVAPTIKAADVIEDKTLRARAVSGNVGPKFDAFLDGAQLTLVARWQGTVPIVFGTVAAAVRVRRERRLTTWGAQTVHRALYAPLSQLDGRATKALRDSGVDVVDTLEKRDADSGHPFALQELAYKAVLGDRERIETELAVRWAEREPGVLYVDGGISSNKHVAEAPNIVGVIKSHQTLYADGDALGVVIGLAVGQRSSVMRIESRRAKVASWYLRFADATGRDPFWGLVRVEVALGEAGELTPRADEVSRWILAERLPLALPDARWDKMAYGIHDAEEYLRAIQ